MDFKHTPATTTTNSSNSTIQNKLWTKQDIFNHIVSVVHSVNNIPAYVTTDANVSHIIDKISDEIKTTCTRNKCDIGKYMEDNRSYIISRYRELLNNKKDEIDANEKRTAWFTRDQPDDVQYTSDTDNPFDEQTANDAAIAAIEQKVEEEKQKQLLRDFATALDIADDHQPGSGTSTVNKHKIAVRSPIEDTKSTGRQQSPRHIVQFQNTSRTSQIGMSSCYNKSYVCRPGGLTNLGQYCYFNSLLQVMLSLPAFNEICLKKTGSKICDLYNAIYGKVNTTNVDITRIERNRVIPEEPDWEEPPGYIDDPVQKLLIEVTMILDGKNYPYTTWYSNTDQYMSIIGKPKDIAELFSAGLCHANIFNDILQEIAYITDWDDVIDDQNYKCDSFYILPDYKVDEKLNKKEQLCRYFTGKELAHNTDFYLSLRKRIKKVIFVRYATIQTHGIGVYDMSFILSDFSVAVYALVSVAVRTSEVYLTVKNQIARNQIDIDSDKYGDYIERTLGASLSHYYSISVRPDAKGNLALYRIDDNRTYLHVGETWKTMEGHLYENAFFRPGDYRNKECFTFLAYHLIYIRPCSNIIEALNYQNRYRVVDFINVEPK